MSDGGSEDDEDDDAHSCFGGEEGTMLEDLLSKIFRFFFQLLRKRDCCHEM